jgi:sterol desaturase/sphingolipid hydroxylase (fatty acid hydroxylase superfamily)
LIAYEILDVVVTLVSHANLRVPEVVDRFVRYLVVTPDLHRVHHSTNPEETDSNFSAVLPIWDLIFGTMKTRPRQQLATMPLGLAEVQDQRSESILWLLSVPFRRHLGARARTSSPQASPPAPAPLQVTSS